MSDELQLYPHPTGETSKTQHFHDNYFPGNRVEAITSRSAKAIYSNNYNINLLNGPIA